ncbi:hypothetical protein BT93_L4763 [Corymbia citriodora subsp. variegata]|uniref:2-dehydropantoate 2-reductase n=1 Tax=Corymbia citriodora subsp. variegata TaxID=360336 RepID=A0A8T0CFQ6_CORYI|nr:hypothetical protein BT93_L4763 [Corymbia citriodora subsp. variegata]
MVSVAEHGSVGSKARVLLIGCGGIGSVAALNLELGGKAVVTAVLRSNFTHVKQYGINFRSIDHGVIEGFKPSTIVNQIPDVTDSEAEPFRFIICTTKNTPDVPPTIVDLLKPAVTIGHTVIVLMQNGLNIEIPVPKAFPQNICLSSVTFCGSHEVATGEVLQEDNDRSTIGAFRNEKLWPEDENNAAREFCAIYTAGGKCVADFKPDVAFSRWRKLLYNACLNSMCAVTDLDTGRMQLADSALDLLVRPAMNEIRAAAKAHGIDLPEELVELMVSMDPITMYNPPSMQVDMRKGRFTEFENIVGEPVRAGLSKGVSMPILSTMYSLLKALQWRTRERRGMVGIPARVDHTTTTR